MPGKVTLRRTAREELVRGDRGVVEPQMYTKFSLHRTPRGLAVKPPSTIRGEFRRSVKPSESGGSRMRHAEVKTLEIKRTPWEPNFSRSVSGKLHYLERDGAGIDGRKPELFQADGDGGTERASARDFVEMTRFDPAAYEIIIPPNDGAQIADMNGLTQRVMSKMEDDLGTRLTWVAAVHEKSDAAHDVNRHVHVMVRGVDDEGRELKISHSYITSTMRDVVQREISSYPTTEKEKGWRLGPMSDEEAVAFKRQLEANRPRREERGFTKPRLHEVEQEEARRRTRSRSMGED